MRFVCNGECPKHGFIRTPDGEEGLNYLWPGYKRFLSHVEPTMKIMRDLLRAKQAPAAIMMILRAQEKSVPSASPARNDPCPSGSGKKYKKCCM